VAKGAELPIRTPREGVQPVDNRHVGRSDDAADRGPRSGEPRAERIEAARKPGDLQQIVRDEPQWLV
jgi:hypothetical protein